MRSLITRGVFYILTAVVLAELIRLELSLNWGRLPFNEFGPVQVAQSLFLLTGVVLLYLKFRRSSQHRELSLCMMLFFAILLIRENDQTLELFLPHGSWVYFAAAVFVVLGACFWRDRTAVVSQLGLYSRSLAFGIMLSGMTVLLFSRLFGRRSFWASLMGDDFMRPVKSAAEEGVELLALGLILVAIIEFFLVRDHTRAED
jgi:hypothetical protein